MSENSNNLGSGSQSGWQTEAESSAGPSRELKIESLAGPGSSSDRPSTRQSGASFSSRMGSRPVAFINTSSPPPTSSPKTTPISAQGSLPTSSIYSGFSGRIPNQPSSQQQPSHCIDKRESMLFTAVTRAPMASHFDDEHPETLDLVNDALLKTVARTTACLAEMEVRVGSRTLLACQAVQGLANLRRDVESGGLKGPALTQRLYREQSEILDRLEGIRDSMRECEAHEPICECQLLVPNSISDQYTIMDFFAGHDIRHYADHCHRIVLHVSDAKDPASEAKVLQRMYEGLDDFFKRKDQAGLGEFQPEKARCQTYDAFFESWHRMISPDNKPFLNKMDQELRRLQAVADQQRKKKLHKKKPLFIRRMTDLLKGKSASEKGFGPWPSTP